MTKIDLEELLLHSFSCINDQIEIVTKTARMMDIEAYELRDPNGNFILSPLLVAEAQVLHALTLLKMRDNHAS